MRIGRQFARQARNITEVRVLFGEAVEIFAVQQFAGAARALQQHDLHAALGHRRFQQRQHRAVRGDAGAGGDQQVAAVVVTGIQAEAAVGAGRADLATVLQCLEQGRGGAAGHEADRDIHRLARAQRVVVDGRQRITALGLGAVGVAEMDLDELAGLKIQRLSVITHELPLPAPSPAPAHGREGFELGIPERYGARPARARPAQDLRQRHPGPEGGFPGSGPGRLLRPARPQRRRQVDPDRHHQFPGQPQRGPGGGVRQRPGAQPQRHHAPDRAGAAGDQLQPVREALRHPGELRRLLWRAARGSGAARRRGAEAGPPVGEGPGDEPHAVRRHEAPADDRARDDDPPAPADPGRADRRRGHRDPPRHVARAQGDQRGRHHDHPHHALPGRSRVPVPPLAIINHGQIVEQGPHEELMAREGAYYRLYQAQARQAEADAQASGSEDMAAVA
ncbi:hypothetical protein G6F22_011977 [Rhizopus arrhizus]|nr:hypothetical protein G6F22_011977 [Rhizopus arrhizus]